MIINHELVFFLDSLGFSECAYICDVIRYSGSFYPLTTSFRMTLQNDIENMPINAVIVSLSQFIKKDNYD